MESEIKRLGKEFIELGKKLNPKGNFEKFVGMAVEYGYKAAQSKQGRWTDEDLEKAFDAGSEFETVGGYSFPGFLERLKDFKTQQAIYKNYPNLNASKEEMDEMRKLK